MCANVQACKEVEDCNVIKHLIDFTEATVADPVILGEAMLQIREEEEEEREEIPQKSRSVTETQRKESSQRHIKHPKPSLYVTNFNHILHFLRIKQPCFFIMRTCMYSWNGYRKV